MAEYYIPGLGICAVKIMYEQATICFEAHPDLLTKMDAQEIELIGCCGVCGKQGERLKDDYQCVECRERAGELEYEATFDFG